MRQPLDKILRKKLEDTVVKARDIVEIAVNEALQRLGVADSQAPGYLNDEQRALRNTLRAHARQLGDKLTDGKQEIERLANEMAYEHWHRMLFARYLEQNNLLMYDEYTPVTLDECFELAEEEPDCKDGWELAGRLAQKMLPQIFRADSPVFAIKLSINHINELENLISAIDPATYQAQDSLGWCYQFWQNKKKKQVNESGVKIGAQELSPVTQLFTEPYMVSFLLDNALGAWWANKRLTQDDFIRANNEQELRDKASIPGITLDYLRFIKNEESGQWQPAASGFEKWPEHLSQLNILDPCCGSGHFLVAIFLMLIPMRMELEGLSAKEAADLVLKDNINGLELDQRCVELAAFALALEAWRYPNSGGYRVLPDLQLACSGVSISEAQKEWQVLASGDEKLTDAIKWMEETFNDAPMLGSLIDPSIGLKEHETLLWELLKKNVTNNSIISNEATSVIQNLLKTCSILKSRYDFVVTNPPYKTKGELVDSFQSYIECYYPQEKSALETVFISRCRMLSRNSGVVSLVLPQNWLFLTSYRELRENLLENTSFDMIAWLGDKAFETPIGVSPILIIFSNQKITDKIAALDVSENPSVEEKKLELTNGTLNLLSQSGQMGHPDSRISFQSIDVSNTLSESANCYQGLRTGDKDQFVRKNWEVSTQNHCWDYFRSPNAKSDIWGGMSDVIFWENGGGKLAKYAKENRHKLHDMHESGNLAWGKKGIAVNEQGLNTSIYCGSKFDASVSVIFPKESSDLIPLLLYCGSDEYILNIRKLDRKRSVTNATLLKVPFDKNKWISKSGNNLNSILTMPFSNDPTQWIFHGSPCFSVDWDEQSKKLIIGKMRQDDSALHVAVARLLGHCWPAELDFKMELAPEMRQIIQRNADLNELIDEDGIVCIPAVRGEKTAAKRLADILYKSYGDAWSSSVEDNLLKSVKAKDFESWLRDKFFEQHCKLFQHRPFIWHIWDGLKDGFSALVNYHKLDYKGLERLIYTYLDDWISVQKRGVAEGIDGADIRLTAAENLKVQLEAILEGEKGLDIFVRWKLLKDQPVGWNPDINDGIRLNIRPFMLAKDVGKKGAGVLRSQPNINWKKDRGTDVESAPWYKLGLQYGGNLGDRINDHHLTLAEKREARENKGL
jgi:hypothetical protein